ncbi:unnamed protein product [Gadus morhua 'NCC']
MVTQRVKGGTEEARWTEEISQTNNLKIRAMRRRLPWTFWMGIGISAVRIVEKIFRRKEPTWTISINTLKKTALLRKAVDKKIAH